MENNFSGIYCIESKINSQKYIGQAGNIGKRWREHIWELKHNKHENKYLQNIYNKYGFENLYFYVVEECDIDVLSDREIYYIKTWKTKRPYGINLTDGGEGLRGYEPSKETRNKMSESSKNRFTEEVRKEWSERFMGEGNPRFGAVLTEETKRKISLANTGRKASEKTKENMSKAKKGKKRIVTWVVSEQTKKKISDTLKGNSFGWKKSVGVKRNKNKSVSKFVGVSVYKRTGRWRAFMGAGKKSIHLGYFDSEEEAALAYNIGALECYGEGTPLNTIENYTPEMEEKVRKIISSDIPSKKCNSASKYFGVTFDSRSGKWLAKINFENKILQLGSFKHEIEAALAVNEALLEYYGWKAQPKLNQIPQFEIDALWEGCNKECCIA